MTSHDDAFAEFQRAKREREQAAVKVTWRRVSADTGGGYSGLGPGGRLVFIWPPKCAPGGVNRDYVYGRNEHGLRTICGHAPSFAAAKAGATKLFGASDG